jgi:hypothetical protein
MKISSLSLSAAMLAIAVVLFTIPAAVHADTYTVYNLGDAEANVIYGITSSGEVVTHYNGCNPGSSCYTDYIDGAKVGTSTTAPVFTYDDGTSCAIPSGFAFSGAATPVCNNGRIGFGSRLNPNRDQAGIYTGPTGDLSLIQTFGSTDQLALNSVGDFAWVDGIDEYIYEAIDTSTAITPEPNTILLVGSGMLSLMELARRRLRQI